MKIFFFEAMTWSFDLFYHFRLQRNINIIFYPLYANWRLEKTHFKFSLITRYFLQHSYFEQ